MRIRLQIGWPLADIPNLEGFRFRGVTEDGDLIPCVVMCGDDGMHYAARESDGERIYHELRGWMQWLPPNAEDHARRSRRVDSLVGRDGD